MKQEFPFKVVLSGKTVAQASTLAEARAEAKRVGGIAMAGRGYAKRNPRQKKLNQKDYTHYLVDVRIGKIASGWSYPEDAKEQQKELLTDFPSAKGAIKVVTKRGLAKFGCNPDDNGCWSDPVELQEVITAHTAKRNPAKRNPSQQEHAKRGQERLRLAQDAYHLAAIGKNAASNLEMAITWAGMSQSDLQDASDWDRAALASQLLNDALMMVPKVIRKR